MPCLCGVRKSDDVIMSHNKSYLSQPVARQVKATASVGKGRGGVDKFLVVRYNNCR